MTPSRPLLSGLVLTLGALAACTEQDTIPPEPRASTVATINSAPTSATTATAPSTIATPTSPPVSTTVDDGTATTVPAPPSSPAGRPAGQPTSVATDYLVGGDPDGWLYLGRWTGSDWERATSGSGSTGATSLGTDVAVGVHELGVDPIIGTTGSSATACSDGRTGLSVEPTTRAPADPGFGFSAIAFPSDWDTRPRRAAIVEANIDAYLAAGVAAFEDTIVDTVDGAIIQTVVSDLDGDGDSESLVTYGGGGYSALLLIDASSGSSRTVARSISNGGSPPVDYDTYHVRAVVDMNGDGLMEFVVHSWRGDRSSSTSTATAYAYDGGDVEAVLSVTC